MYRPEVVWESAPFAIKVRAGRGTPGYSTGEAVAFIERGRRHFSPGLRVRLTNSSEVEYWTAPGWYGPLTAWKVGELIASHLRSTRGRLACKATIYGLAKIAEGHENAFTGSSCVRELGVTVADIKAELARLAGDRSSVSSELCGIWRKLPYEEQEVYAPVFRKDFSKFSPSNRLIGYIQPAETRLRIARHQESQPKMKRFTGAYYLEKGARVPLLEEW